MAGYEYRVIPAPAKGAKARGVKSPEAKFAHALQELMNRMGADGWEYQRAETLPSTERAGLTGTTTNWRHVLVFRRVVKSAGEVAEKKAETTPALILSLPPAPANDPGLAAPPRDTATEPGSEIDGVDAPDDHGNDVPKTPGKSDV